MVLDDIAQSLSEMSRVLGQQFRYAVDKDVYDEAYSCVEIDQQAERLETLATRSADALLWAREICEKADVNSASNSVEIIRREAARLRDVASALRQSRPCVLKAVLDVARCLKVSSEEPAV